MTNFEFYSPTKVIFGKDVVSRLGQEAKEFGGKALLLYGRESIKKNGLYDLIVKQCAEAGIELTEHSGVSPNPVLSHASEGVRIAREAGVDFIIAAGGGSVIDESKVISAGTANDAPLWDLVSRKAPVEKALPIVAIQTLPATSSETNQVGVLTNKETNEKFSIKSPLLVPAKAFLDPQLTFTIPKKYSAYACFDIMSHMLEGYFTMTADFAPAHEGFVEGLSGAVKISLDRILKDPEDYEARANVMWVAMLAWNGIAKAGLEGAALPNHMLEHPLSAVYDVAHGAGLTIVFPAWLEYRKREIGGRILRFGEKILGMDNLSGLSEEAAVDKVIAAFKEWLTSIGCPLTMREAGVENPDIDELVKQALTLCEFWGIKGYTADDLEAIYRLCV